VDVELARQQWADGHRRVDAARGDDRRYAALMARVETVLAGLRVRIGQIFTLQQLADAYDGADDWAIATLDEADPDAVPTREPGTITDAAFYLYAQGAQDYRP
jgi:hypothetical protein